MMKKRVLMFFVAAAARALPMQAQKLSYGVKAGMNFTHISFDKSLGDNVKNRAGFHIGPTIKLTLPVPGLMLDASALYDYRSAKAETYTAAGDKTLKQHSVQVPINVRYGVGLGSVANLFAFAGPQFGFNIGEKHQTIIQGVQEWTLRSSNFSANFGLGATLYKHLQVTVNYNLPFGKTGDLEYKDIYNGVTYIYKNGTKANAWQVSVAYFL